MKNKNMNIWDKAQETDPKFTKKDYGGFTSINGIYLIRKATSIFGAMGIGWGFEILEERYDEGVPFMTKDVGQVMAKSHTIKLELWFKQDGELGKVVNFGHTKYIYKTKNGHMIDEEAPKKSLTDAIKKCLSMLGFSADIFMGQYEDRDYVDELTRRSEVEHADDKDAERLKQVTEYREWVESELKAYSMIDDASSLQNVYNSHMKNANRRGSDWAKEKFTKTYENRIKEIETCK